MVKQHGSSPHAAHLWWRYTAEALVSRCFPLCSPRILIGSLWAVSISTSTLLLLLILVVLIKSRQILVVIEIPCCGPLQKGRIEVRDGIRVGNPPRQFRRQRARRPSLSSDEASRHASTVCLPVVVSALYMTHRLVCVAGKICDGSVSDAAVSRCCVTPRIGSHRRLPRRRGAFCVAAARWGGHRPLRRRRTCSKEVLCITLSITCKHCKIAVGSPCATIPCARCTLA